MMNDGIDETKKVETIPEEQQCFLKSIIYVLYRPLLFNA